MLLVRGERSAAGRRDRGDARPRRDGRGSGPGRRRGRPAASMVRGSGRDVLRRLRRARRVVRVALARGRAHHRRWSRRARRPHVAIFPLQRPDGGDVAGGRRAGCRAAREDRGAHEGDRSRLRHVRRPRGCWGCGPARDQVRGTFGRAHIRALRHRGEPVCERVRHALRRRRLLSTSRCFRTSPR